MVLSDTEYRIVAEVQALDSGVACDQKLDCGDHTRVCDEVEEAGDVLLVEDEVIRGVIALQYQTRRRSGRTSESDVRSGKTI